MKYYRAWRSNGAINDRPIEIDAANVHNARVIIDAYRSIKAGASDWHLDRQVAGQWRTIGCYDKSGDWSDFDQPLKLRND